ncbi:MAG: SDR family NAD(P)-dependent oxidoreductase [Phototrophicaceae bacterium]
MSRILLTGAAGFIGFRTAQLLLEDGHTVLGLDSLNDAYDVRLKHWRLERLQPLPNFTFCQLDVTDVAALEKLWQQHGGFDAVIHLAGRAGVRPSVDHPRLYYDTNTLGTLNLLELCRAHQTEKFVLASTSSLYGELNPTPYSEDANTDRTISPYAASKKAAEVLCYTYHQLHKIDVTVHRYFTVYGPAGRPDMSVMRFIQWISEGRTVKVYGNGQQSRDFTFVDDIARGTIAGMKYRGGYEVINLGNDRPALLMDVLHLVEQGLGRTANIEYHDRHPADVSHTWADITKARTLLGWQPQTDIQTGIARTISWYREHEGFARTIETGN